MFEDVVFSSVVLKQITQTNTCLIMSCSVLKKAPKRSLKLVYCTKPSEACDTQRLWGSVSMRMLTRPIPKIRVTVKVAMRTMKRLW